MKAQSVETFGSGQPTGWTNFNSTGTTSSNGKWKFSGNPGYAMSGTSSHTADGSHFAWVDGSSPYPLTVTMQTDVVDLNNYINPHLSFWLKKNKSSASYNSNEFKVEINHSGGTITQELSYSQNTLNGDWEEFVIDLTGYSGQIQARFVLVKQSGSGSFYDDTAIDDVSFYSVANLDASPTGISNLPNPVCTIDTNIAVDVTNYGGDTITSLAVNWLVNGVAMTPVSSSDTILPGNTGSIALGTVSSLQFGDVVTVITGNVNGQADELPANDTLVYEYIQGLSGTYYIGPFATDDYSSFGAAIADLYDLGICGPLTFMVQDSLYVEQIDFDGDINGASASNLVTFQSVDGADSCIITWGSTSSAENYILNAGTSHLKFDGFTFLPTSSSYARSVVSTEAIENFTLTNSIVLGVATTSTSNWRSNLYFYNQAFKDITITNNEIYNGSYSCYLYGNYNANGSNLVFDNNKVVNPYYAHTYLYYWNDISVQNNEFLKDGGATYSWGGYGIYGGTLNGDVKVMNNLINSDSIGFPRYGIYNFSVTGTFGEFAQYSNNRIWMGEGGATGNTYYGIYVSTPLFVQVANNSIVIDSASSSSSRGIYLAGGAANFMYNNAVTNYGSGNAVYISSGATLAESDHNSFYSNGNVGYLGGNHATLADWQAATGMDSNSISVRDWFTDRMRIATCEDSLNGMGMPLANLMYDYEGQMRHATTPDIGADEFSSVASFSLGDGSVLCDGSTLDIEAAYWDTVTWSTGYVGNTVTVTTPGIYSAIAVGACGTAYDTVDVQPQTMPSLPATANICDADSTMLDPAVGAGAMYTWNDGSTDSTITVNAPGTYSVAIVDAYGCSSVDTAVITQSPVVALDDTYEFCEGDQADLDAAIPGSYMWNDGSSNQFLTVTSPGVYWVEVTDGFSCVSADTTEVIEILLPVAMFGTDTNTSSFYTVIFSDSSMNNTDWLWDFGDGTTSTDPNPIHVYPTTWGIDTYTVTLTVTNECGTDSYEGQVVLDMVGVEELANGDKVNVYPNPNNGEFNVNVVTQDNREVSMEVVDVQGRIVMSQSYGSVNGTAVNNVSLGSVANGIYFVKVYVEGEVSIHRITVH